MFSLIEQAKVITIQVPKDMTGSSALAPEYISMKDAERLSFIIALGALGSIANMPVALRVADDASGTHNRALFHVNFHTSLFLDHYFSRAASTDAWTRHSVASSTFNLTKSSSNKSFLIEVEAAKMGIFDLSSISYDANYVALSIGAPGAAACLMSVWAILTGLRYQEDSPPSAIV